MCSDYFTLTHISLESFLWDIGKQCRPRPGAAESGVWSGSPLFVCRMFYKKFNKNEKYHPTSLKRNGMFLLIAVGNSIRLKWVNTHPYIFSGMQSFNFSGSHTIWPMTWDFQQCGMCDQQSFRSACAYAQSDQILCFSLEYSMTVKLLTEHHIEFLPLKGGWTGMSESTHVKMPHCWKSHITAHIVVCFLTAWLIFLNPWRGLSGQM